MAILALPVERSSQLLRGDTLKSRKFLQAIRHKNHTLTFLVRTTPWRLTIKFLLPRTYRMAAIPRPKIITSTTRPPQLVPILLLVPKSLLHGIPITATAQELHHAQYLQPHKISHGPNDSPPPKSKKIPAHHIAILVPHDELFMKTYMHAC